MASSSSSNLTKLSLSECHDMIVILLQEAHITQQELKVTKQRLATIEMALGISATDDNAAEKNAEVIIKNTIVSRGKEPISNKN